MQALRELRARKPGSLLVRTDFSDEQAWFDIRRRATAPVLVTGGDEFLADVRVVDDRSSKVWRRPSWLPRAPIGAWGKWPFWSTTQL